VPLVFTRSGDPAESWAMDWLTLSPQEWTAVQLSLSVASVATLVSLAFGVAIALVLARGRFWKGAS
jgi:molybdate transport system permease protein